MTGTNKRIIEVLPYKPQWSEKFDCESKLITSELGNIVLNIHHIGSTAVKGLPAKPVIDMLLEVSSLEALDRNNSAMQALGYLAKGENGLAGRRYFQKGGENRSHHLHAFAKDDESLLRHLAFRDYLRAHPDVAAQYADIKLDAVKHCNNQITNYMRYKNAFIQHHEALAIIWFKGTTSSPGKAQ